MIDYSDFQNIFLYVCLSGLGLFLRRRTDRDDFELVSIRPYGNVVLHVDRHSKFRIRGDMG